MLNYEGNLLECFAAASEDREFNRQERQVLELLSNWIMTEENEDDVISESFGTGRIYGITQSDIRFLIHDSDNGYNIGVVDRKINTSKAMQLLLNLEDDQIIRHKREDTFYIERINDELFASWRNGTPTVKNIDYMEVIIKHHNTRNWEVVESLHSERHPILSM